MIRSGLKPWTKPASPNKTSVRKKYLESFKDENVHFFKTEKGNYIVQLIFALLAARVTTCVLNSGQIRGWDMWGDVS